MKINLSDAKQALMSTPDEMTREQLEWRIKATKQKHSRLVRNLEDACTNSKMKPHYIGDDPNVRAVAEAGASLYTEILWLEEDKA